MSEAALTIPFSNPSSEAAAKDCLIIEQKPWGQDVGKTTKLQGIQGIAAAAHGIDWPEARCGGALGIFYATVYVYTCQKIKSYRFDVSHGFVDLRTMEIAYRDEIVESRFDLQQKLDYPPLMVATYGWLGDCYDHKGNITSRPVVTVATDGTVTFSKEVWGSLRVKYTVRRDIFRVSIHRRLDATENKYVSVAYCVWDGGVKWIDIDPPAGFEAFDGDCGNGGGDDGGPGGFCRIKKRDIPVSTSADFIVTKSYCDQEDEGYTIDENVNWREDKSGCPDD